MSDLQIVALFMFFILQFALTLDLVYRSVSVLKSKYQRRIRAFREPYASWTCINAKTGKIVEKGDWYA